MIRKTSCIIGHRDVVLSNEDLKKLKEIFENLIIKDNVKIFLFGSRSNFDFTCHKIITELMTKYSYIERKCYTCKGETCILESERKYWEQIYSKFHKKEMHFLGVEEEVDFKEKWKAGKASYVERNQAMINDSDICVFYYNENYQPKLRKHSGISNGNCQPKSGISLAYNYAKKKKKKIINAFDILCNL